jgi:TPR repeat protein
MAQLATVKNGDLDQNDRAFLWVKKILLKGDSSCLDVMPRELMGVFAKRQKAQIWRGSSRVEKDIEKALYNKACKYELKACLKGYKKAGDELFADFIQSGGLPSDCDQFMRICQDSANYNNVKAMRCLGIIYEKGICTNQDLSASLILYQKIDKLSPSTQSKTDLCRVLGNKDFPVDLEGIEYIKQKANENLPEAIFQLGLMYEEGRNFSKDLNKAIEFYLKISSEEPFKERHPKASYRLAEYYFNRKEYKKARSFLLDDDDAHYLRAIIDYSQYDYPEKRVEVFKILSNLSKKGYQKATNFIKNHY